MRRKGLIVVSIPFGALLFGFVAIYTAQKTEDRAEDWLVRTELVRSDLRAARNALIDAETSVRGFVISGDEKFLLPYQRAQTVFPRRARDVEELLEDNPDQLRHLAELKNLVAARFSAFAKLIEAARQKNEHVFDAQRSQLVQEGDMPMEQVRAKFREMDQAEDRLDVEENKNLDKLRKTASITIGFSAAFGVLGGWQRSFCLVEGSCAEFK